MLGRQHRCIAHSVAERIAGWDSDYTAIRGTPGGPPGRPPPGPPPGAPGQGPPRGGKFPGARAGGPGAPPGAPGRPRAPPAGGPKMGPFGGHLDYILYYRPPLWGGPPGVPFLAPRGAPPPRGAKKCTFFWVFNNSPSRDSFLGFFGPPGQGPRTGYPGQDRPYGGIGGSTPSSYRACPGTMPSPCAAC